MKQITKATRNSEEERLPQDAQNDTLLSSELEGMMRRSELGPSPRRDHRRRPCSLPCDTLTEQELQERNGPVTSWNLNGPMTPGRFRTMPEDLQDLYLLRLQERIFGKDATV